MEMGERCRNDKWLKSDTGLTIQEYTFTPFQFQVSPFLYSLPAIFKASNMQALTCQPNIGFCRIVIEK